MATTKGEPPQVYSPEEAVEKLGLKDVRRLVALLKRTGAPYVSFSDGRPFERNSWGMTADQIRDLVESRTRAIRPPADAPDATPSVALSRFGHDGKLRLRRRTKG